MTTFDGTPAEAAVETPSDVIYAQSYCTLAELDEDLNLLGSEREERILPKIKTASDFLRKNIGLFQPVTMQCQYNGRGKKTLRINPLLSITSIVNNSLTLAENDYILYPPQRYWGNGPYAWIDVDYLDATSLSAWMDQDQGVQITGRWGMFDLAQSLDATITSAQTADATLIYVSNGSKISAGMVIVIGAEQQYIKGVSSPVTETTLSAAVDSETQIMPLTSGTQVSIGEIIRIGFEQMKVTDISGNSAAVIRGWNRTQRASHAISAEVEVYRVFNVTRGVNGTTAAVHALHAQISQQMVPDDINMLCRKMAGRMLKDAQGGFSGVLGDPSMGTAQYLYILPKELEAIRASYRIIHTAVY